MAGDEHARFGLYEGHSGSLAGGKLRKHGPRRRGSVDGLIGRSNGFRRNRSGGEQQRVCIARAIVNNPKIIFADEPTGNLDSATGDKITDLLFDLNRRGVTLIIVTHDEDLAKLCSRIIRISDGKIIDDYEVKKSERTSAEKRHEKTAALVKAKNEALAERNK